MTMASLFELTAQYREAAEKLEELDLPAEVVADTLEGLAGDLTEKATNIGAFVRNLEATAAAIKEAEADMAKRRKAIEARAESIRAYLLSNMLAAGIQKIECPWFTLVVRENPASVVIDDADAIPADYMREIPARMEIEKTLIKQAIKDGYDVPGAHLARGKRLHIG